VPLTPWQAARRPRARARRGLHGTETIARPAGSPRRRRSRASGVPRCASANSRSISSARRPRVTPGVEHAAASAPSSAPECPRSRRCRADRGAHRMALRRAPAPINQDLGVSWRRRQRGRDAPPLRNARRFAPRAARADGAAGGCASCALEQFGLPRTPEPLERRA